jgi:hypothetical protein
MSHIRVAIEIDTAHIGFAADGKSQVRLKETPLSFFSDWNQMKEIHIGKELSLEHSWIKYQQSKQFLT